MFRPYADLIRATSRWRNCFTINLELRLTSPSIKMPGRIIAICATTARPNVRTRRATRSPQAAYAPHRSAPAGCRTAPNQAIRPRSLGGCIYTIPSATISCKTFAILDWGHVENTPTAVSTLSYSRWPSKTCTANLWIVCSTRISFLVWVLPRRPIIRCARWIRCALFPQKMIA